MLTAIQQIFQGNWRLWAGSLLGFSLLCAPGVTAQTERDEARTQAELERLRERMQAVRERLEDDRAERSDEEARIASLDLEIAETAARVRQTRDQLAAVRAELERLDERSRELSRRRAAHREQLARLAYAAYVMGRQTGLKLFLNQRSPGAANRMLGYHEYVVSARGRKIARIKVWAAETTALKAEQAARESELEALQAEHRSEREALEARRREREVALAALKDRIASREGELSRLKENETRLKRVLSELREYLATQRSLKLEEGVFREMKGKLRLPVSAPIAAGFGEPRSTGVRWDGLMFHPESGTEVKAIFQGRVVFADWLRGFGLLLIVDHGDGFMSLYSHNQSLFKQVGDPVGTGEAIATVGTSGGLDRPGLYFEIRHDGEPQNPLTWCQRA